MKQMLILYALIGLVLLAGLSVLSYGHGMGFVYLHWHGWQLQSNLWLLLFGLWLLSLVLQLFYTWGKNYYGNKLRKQTDILKFNDLHPYEQLAVVWLLDAGRDQADFIQSVFGQSGLLKSVMQAKLYTLQQQYPQALSALEHSHSMAFELVQLQRIEIYLAQKDPQQVLTHLEFLQQHQLSTWLEPVAHSYQLHLNTLWQAFALEFPWHYLKAKPTMALPQAMQMAWLEQLAQQFEQADEIQLQDLLQHYLLIEPNFSEQNVQIQLLWLKLLSRMPHTQPQQLHLAEVLLSQQFNQDAFYLWFQQQFLNAAGDYQAIEHKIEQWEKKYPALPVLSFAKWHIYQAKGQYQQAEELLQHYPEHILFNYLRIKSHLNQQEDLIKQLNAIFENNVHYMAIKL